MYYVLAVVLVFNHFRVCKKRPYILYLYCLVASDVTDQDIFSLFQTNRWSLGIIQELCSFMNPARQTIFSCLFFFCFVFFLLLLLLMFQPSKPIGAMSSAVSYPNHTFTGQWQLSFSNQRKGKNDCRKYCMITLHARMLPDPQSPDHQSDAQPTKPRGRQTIFSVPYPTLLSTCFQKSVFFFFFFFLFFFFCCCFVWRLTHNKQICHFFYVLVQNAFVITTNAPNVP